MPDRPISVVIPTRGTRESLRRAVESCLAGSVHPQVIVSVDGDANGPQVQEMVAGLPVAVDLGPSAGVCATRNRGARRADGEWLTFLDDDDRIAPGWLDRCAEVMMDPAIHLILGVTMVEGEDSSNPVPPQFTLDPSSPHISMLPGSWVVRRGDFFAVGGFDESLKYSENLELGFRLSSHVAHERAAALQLEDIAVHMCRDITRDRVKEYGMTRAAAAERILSQHATRFSGAPRANAAWLRVVSHGYRGVDPRRSRAAARKAVSLDPWTLENWKSALLALGQGRRHQSV